MSEVQPKVFISYSWSAKKKVMELAERFREYGVDAIVDVWDLKAGQDKYAFMERSATDPTVTQVLIICDKAYTEKANGRQGGVGDETVIISPEVYGKVNQQKVIPIIFEMDENGNPYIPQYLKGRIYFDLSSDDTKYEEEFERLIRSIYNEPLYKKPALGRKPEWLQPDNVNLSAIKDTIKQIKGCSDAQNNKADYLIRHAVDLLVEKALEFVLPKDKPEEDGILIVIDKTLPYRDAFMEFCEAVLFSGLPFENAITMFFEKLYNRFHRNRTSSEGIVSKELNDYMIWEMFICMTALLLHMEKYRELHEILAHTYFLYEDYYNDYFRESFYSKFKAYCSIIEEKCKPKSKNPKLYTMQGDILVNRERPPYLTKKSISNADLVLCQMAEPLGLSSSRYFWFPFTYCYHREEQEIWKRLKSRSHCQKVMELFGVSDIEELKEKLKLSFRDSRIRYNSDHFDCALCIQDSINIDEVGTLY